MNHNEAQLINDLFVKLSQAEKQSGKRDTQAEALISDHLHNHPTIPYYMVRVLLMQEYTLAQNQQRIKKLEDALANRSTTSSQFMPGSQSHHTRSSVPQSRAPYTERASDSRKNAENPSRGGGFLPGIMQTALGVAGGMFLANTVSSLFSGSDSSGSEDSFLPDATADSEFSGNESPVSDDSSAALMAVDLISRKAHKMLVRALDKLQLQSDS